MKFIAAATLLCGLLTASEAFVVPSTNGLAVTKMTTTSPTTTTTTTTTTTSQLFESTLSAEDSSEESDAPVNEKYPNLPEVKGDFDWDAKFGGDDDWITENVPGKIVLDDITLAKQVTALSQLEDKYRKERVQDEFEDFQVSGWVVNSELLNSRFAMFFLAVGLFTESFTGLTMPGQCEEMLRILGFIGFD